MLNIAPIAGNTFRQTVGAGIFWLLALAGTAGIWTILFIPFFTFREDVKMFKDVGCALVLTVSLIVALMSASRVVDEEFENRTAITLMSKPVRDYELLLGKWLGVLATVLCMVVILGVSLDVSSYIRLYMDDFWRARAASNDKYLELLDDCALQMWSLLPCIALIGLQATVLTSISTALSTRLPLAPNAIICVLLFVGGHLTPLILSWSEFRMADSTVSALRSEGVPDSVLAKLDVIRNRRFNTESEMAGRLAELLDRVERDRHERAIIDRSAGWAAARGSASSDWGQWFKQTAGQAFMKGLTLVVPDLERAYNVLDAVAYQPMIFGAAEPVPDKVRWGDAWLFVLSSAVYTVLYCSAVLLVGLAMLRRREVST